MKKDDHASSDGGSSEDAAERGKDSNSAPDIRVGDRIAFAWTKPEKEFYWRGFLMALKRSTTRAPPRRFLDLRIRDIKITPVTLTRRQRTV